MIEEEQENRLDLKEFKSINKNRLNAIFKQNELDGNFDRERHEEFLWVHQTEKSLTYYMEPQVMDYTI